MPRFFYQPTVYLVLHWQFIHEVLHFLSGLIGCFLGCWAYAALAKRREKRAAAKAEAAARREL
jgi:cbb3-type cytochrome oxidase subunit 3